MIHFQLLIHSVLDFLRDPAISTFVAIAGLLVPLLLKVLPKAQKPIREDELD